MNSLYGSMTRSAVISLSNFRFATFFPPMRSPKSKLKFVECGRPPAESSHVCGGFVIDQIGHDVDVAVGGFRVRALQMRSIYQLLGGFSIYTGKADIQASLNEVMAIRCAQVYFSINGDIRR